MARKPGRKTQPTELKRRRGNPGKRKLPDEDQVTALAPAAVGGIPTPIRPLGNAGTAEWNLVWREAFAWLSGSDLLAVQRYCEAVDDYVIIRSRMLEAQADERMTETQLWRLRKQVNDMSKLCDDLGSVLGLGRSYRSDIGVAKVPIAEGVANLMEREPTVALIDEKFIDVEVIDDDD